MVLATTMLLIFNTIISGGLFTNLIDNYSYAIFAVIGFFYLSNPLLGLLGENWMTYKVTVVQIILFVGFFIAMVILVTLHFMHLNGIAVVSITLATFPYFLGYGIFEANVIQFVLINFSLHHLKS